MPLTEDVGRAETGGMYSIYYKYQNTSMGKSNLRQKYKKQSWVNGKDKRKRFWKRVWIEELPIIESRPIR